MPRNNIRDDSWKALKKRKANPKNKRAASTWRARLRKMWKISRLILWLCLVCGLAGGLYYACQRLNFSQLVSTNAPAIRTIEFKSDGVITSGWLGKLLSIPKDSTLSDINIFELRKTLEDISQIRTANVERVYPDVLRIVVVERKPIAKIELDSVQKSSEFLVADNGFIFRPICYSAEQMAKFIRIEDANFTKDRRFMDAEKFAKFVEYARKRFPSEVDTWQVANVSQMRSLTFPIIKIRTSGGTLIIFDITNPQEQFDKFDNVLRYSKGKSLNDFEKIDLTLKGSASAKLKKASR